jgi:hypothetical protein
LVTLFLDADLTQTSKEQLRNKQTNIKETTAKGKPERQNSRRCCRININIAGSKCSKNMSSTLDLIYLETMQSEKNAKEEKTK